MRRLMLAVIIVVSMLLVGCEEKPPKEMVTLYEDARLECSSRFRVLSEHYNGNNSQTSERITIMEDTDTGVKYILYYRFPHQFAMTRLWEK